MFRVGVMVRKRGISERKDGRIYRVIGSSYALGEREATWLAKLASILMFVRSSRVFQKESRNFLET